MNPPLSFQVAVLHWSTIDGIAQVIEDELHTLGHRPFPVFNNAPIPPHTEIVFTSGPYGQLYAFLSQLEGWLPRNRPVVVHWNTEGIPSPVLPWFLVRMISSGRAWLDRLRLQNPGLARLRLLSILDKRMLRYRYVGDYAYLYKKGLLHVLADSSALYAHIRSQHGLPTVYAPWGATPRWYADLQIGRDIDVLWMGKRATRRRSDLLDLVRHGLRPHGIEIYVADNVENPFIFDQERTQFLNRAKITLNITRTWYDDNFSRFALAAPNRSLVVSEPMLAHCPAIEAGTHYLSTPPEKLVDTILYYLQHETEWQEIVERAYQLFTQQLTFQHSVSTIMAQVAYYKKEK